MNQSDVLLELAEVERRSGMKKSAIYAKIKAKKFPAPVKVDGYASRWVESEIQQWIDALKEARDNIEAAA